MKRSPPIASAVVGTILFTIASAAMVPTIVHAIRLKLDGVVTEAQVTKIDTRFVSRRSFNSPYLVQYRFRPPGAETSYSHDELMISGSPMAEVTKPVWDRAKETGKIEVIYCRHDPAVNLPYPPFALNGILCSSIAAGAGVLLALACGLSLIRGIAARRKGLLPTD